MTCPRNPIFLHSIHRNDQGAAGPVSGCFPIDFHLLPSHTLILWDCLLLPLLFPCPDICIHTRGRPWFNFLRPFLPQFSARKKKKKKKNGRDTENLDVGAQQTVPERLSIKRCKIKVKNRLNAERSPNKTRAPWVQLRPGQDEGKQAHLVRYTKSRVA